MHRREFLKVAALAALSTRCSGLQLDGPQYRYANDIHSQLNPTRLLDIVPIDSRKTLIDTIQRAAREKMKISIAGSRHAMGGQQFGRDTLNLDMRALRHIGELDRNRGVIEVGAGVEWPQLVEHLVRIQDRDTHQWGIAQKQTGADRLTLGGALSANAHGRGLRMKPFVGDIESFTMVLPHGELVECSRDSNRELFAMAVGGYGLIGAVDTIRLRLVPRQQLERVVEIRTTDGLMEAMEQRIAAGYTYGDFQFSIDERSERFMREGVFSCYRPVTAQAVREDSHAELSRESWSELMQLAHFDKAKAYELYTAYYLSTTGQLYWSDTHQLATYVDDYHHAIDTRMRKRGSEIITEIYVPRERLRDFMEEGRAGFIEHRVNLFYGTVRLIERDDETFLAWARQPYACVIFNLHTEHTESALAETADAFRRLIDLAIRRGGSYYLTYHRFARRDQVDACYPQLPAFLKRKREIDPTERFESDWYLHYRSMYASA